MSTFGRRVDVNPLAEANSLDALFRIVILAARDPGTWSAEDQMVRDARRALIGLLWDEDIVRDACNALEDAGFGSQAAEEAIAVIVSSGIMLRRAVKEGE